MSKHFLLVLAAATLPGLPAQAQDNDAVMAKLRQMQEQMARMQKEMDALKAELAQSTAENRQVKQAAESIRTDVKTVQAVAAEVKEASKPRPGDVKVTMNPAPKFQTADGAYSFAIGGFAQVDGGTFSDDVRDHPNGTAIRRARLRAYGTIDYDWDYKIDYDFASTANTVVGGLNDTYLAYKGFKQVTLQAGHFRESFGLDTVTSDTWTSFMERALPHLFSPDRSIGAAVSTYGGTKSAWTYTLGAFGGKPNVTGPDDEAIDITSRFTYAPVAEKDRLLHFGIAGSHRIPDSASDQFRFQSRAENRLASAQSIDTLAIAAVENVNLLGLEFSSIYGPLGVQGEYVRAMVNRAGGLPNESFSGYYGEATYFLTGESKDYKRATAAFDRVEPHAKLDIRKGQWGAWQLGARYSQADLNGKRVRGGKLKDITLGVKWIPHNNLLFMANYVRAFSDGYAVSPHDDPEIYMMRAQFYF